MRAAPRAASVWLSEARPSENRRSEARPPTSLGERPDRQIFSQRTVLERVIERPVARLVRSADFERVLRTRTRVSSAHFAIHHVAAWPSTPAKPVRAAVEPELSTGESVLVHKVVDDLVAGSPARVAPITVGAAPQHLWLGAVVPKRHAKRSVTRTLLKRQIRAVVAGHSAALAGGLWVVRLRAPFDRAHFVSAASDAMRRAAHDELDGLMSSATLRVAVAR